MTLFKNYLDNEISSLQSTEFSDFQGYFKASGSGGFSVGDVCLPLFAPIREDGILSGFNAQMLLGAGERITITGEGNFFKPKTFQYAEMYVVNTSGTEAFGVEADGGVSFISNGEPTWTNVSTFGIIGTDLSDGGNGSIVSTAGGLFLVRFSVLRRSNDVV